MAGTSPPKTPYLALDELATDPKLARRLPVDLARRFHALPLAEEKGRVTVAMADPEDAAAREAIERVLGPALYLVQADVATIDTLVAEIWGEEANRPLRLVVIDAPTPATATVWNYARTLAGLLGADLSRLDLECVDDISREGERSERDLVIVDETDHPLIRRLLPVPTERAPVGVARRDPLPMPSALLAVRRPRWPLRRLLLLLCGEERDYAAAGWVLRLARQCGSAVTVLALVPPVPATNGRRAGTDQGLPGLLSSETRLGRQIRTVARRLVNSGIDGTLRLRQGASDGQIEGEVAEGDYDLVAVAVCSCPRERPRLSMDLVSALLHRTDRPVLIVNSPAAQENV
jgi:nucleotide-binding universal stress UspA family protein